MIIQAGEPAGPRQAGLFGKPACRLRLRIGSPRVVLAEFHHRKDIFQSIHRRIERRVLVRKWLGPYEFIVSVFVLGGHCFHASCAPEDHEAKEPEQEDGKQNPQRLFFEPVEDKGRGAEEQKGRASLLAPELIYNPLGTVGIAARLQDLGDLQPRLWLV